MEEKIKFNITKYLGIWYELAHYPSWFQKNDNYNTTATYELDDNGDIIVINSTISNGKVLTSVGKGVKVSTAGFRVGFPDLEKMKIALANSTPTNHEASPFGKFSCERPEAFTKLPEDLPNYIVEKIWMNEDDEYMIAIVTDSTKDSFYLLSRLQQPSLSVYNVVIQYVIENFDRNRLVCTPHYSL